ncbi:hypothetical protein JCM5353_003713 [Sporobolomyces roseus]
MWANLNLKSLQDKFQESLHDLENSLTVAAPPVASTSSQPASPSTPAANRRPTPSVSTQSTPTRTNSGNLITSPLSPASLANAQQSASQLADSALSSLRASLRKGRQSFDAARASYDGGQGLVSPTARRTTSMDSVRSLTESIREKDEGEKGKGKLEELKEREEEKENLVEVGNVKKKEEEEGIKAVSGKANNVEEIKKEPLLVEVEDEGEDEDAWGVSGGNEEEDQSQVTTPRPEVQDLIDVGTVVDHPLPDSTPSVPLPNPDSLSSLSDKPLSPSALTSEAPEPSIPPPSDDLLSLNTPASSPKELVNPLLDNLKQESFEANQDLTTDTPLPSTMGLSVPDDVEKKDLDEPEEEEEDGWDLPEVEAEEELEASEKKEESLAESTEGGSEGKGKPDVDLERTTSTEEETNQDEIVEQEPKKLLDPLSEPFQPATPPIDLSLDPVSDESLTQPTNTEPVENVEPESLPPREAPVISEAPPSTIEPDEAGPSEYPEDIEDLTTAPRSLSPITDKIPPDSLPTESLVQTDDAPNIASQPDADLPALSESTTTTEPQPESSQSQLSESIETQEVPRSPVPAQGIELVEEQAQILEEEVQTTTAVPSELVEPKLDSLFDEGPEPEIEESSPPQVTEEEQVAEPEELVAEKEDAEIDEAKLEKVEDQSKAEAELDIEEPKLAPEVELGPAATEVGEPEIEITEQEAKESLPIQVELQPDQTGIPPLDGSRAEAETSSLPIDGPALEPIEGSEKEEEEAPKRIDQQQHDQSVILDEPKPEAAPLGAAPTEVEDSISLDPSEPTSAIPEAVEPISGQEETKPVESASDKTENTPVEFSSPFLTERSLPTSPPQNDQFGLIAPVVSGKEIPPSIDSEASPTSPPLPITDESDPTPVVVDTEGPAVPSKEVEKGKAIESVESSESLPGSRSRAESISQDPRFIGEFPPTTALQILADLTLYLELSASHDRLKTLKTSLDLIVSDLLPSVSTVDDPESLGDELRNLKAKADLGMGEMRRLSGQLEQQKSRIEELRDTHRLEHQSQQAEIDALRDSLAARNASLEESNDKLAAAEKSAEATRQEIVKAADEYDKLKVVAKEEEEKRVKALSLLRALRQKLVKNEQEKATNDQELEKARKGEKDALDTLKSDRARFDKEIVGLRTAHEAVVAKLRSGFEREAQGLKERFEKEAISKRGQFELDAIHVKSTQAKELSAKDARISQLEGAVKDLTKSRDQVFEDVQRKTEEIEATKAEEETLRGRTNEVEYELKEAKDRIAALVDELEEVKRSKRETNRDDSNARKLLAETEARHEARIRDLEARSKQLEKDRQETEEEMGRNMQDRLKEVERMRAALAQKDLDYAESVQNSQKREATIAEAEKAKADLEKRLKNVEEMLKSVKDDADKAINAEVAVREELSDRMQRAAELEARLEEVQTKESTLRSNNKTLREELRKLQSGVLLSEKQRHPGVGYFSSFNSSSNGNPGSPEPIPSGAGQVLSRTESSTSLASTATGGGLSGGARANGSADEALNFEYMRNVILQFLEKPEMRPHLISVLGVILHFTPSESRRLIAKAGH